MPDQPDATHHEIRAAGESAEFHCWLGELLIRLVDIDTSIGRDVGRMAANERAVFDVLTEAALATGCPPEAARRVPVHPAIVGHPGYTPPYYAIDRAGDVYAGRSNLVVQVPGRGGSGRLVVNAHVDTVGPHFGPTRTGGRIAGRGAVDDKGGCAAMIGALWLLNRLQRRNGAALDKPDQLSWHYDVELQFVIEEEMGGNGTLSLVLDDQTPPAAVVVLEPTRLQIHPGGRGATWYQVSIDFDDPAVSAVELALATVLAIDEEGTRIRAESGHPLFPSKPVQTNHGILGPFGDHPSTVCDRVDLLLRCSGRVARDSLDVAIRGAVARYTAAHGDKVAEGRLARHVEVTDHPQGVIVRVFGIAGHMGAVRECDGAILKAAYLWSELPDGWRVALPDDGESGPGLNLEGGQGFLPCHALSAIQARIARAASRGAGQLMQRRGRRRHDDALTVRFDKLHNEAFACDPRSRPVRTLVRRAREMGAHVHEPLVGFQVSCDARLFATVYPTAEVITFGPGDLEKAHAADEEIDIADIARASAALASWILQA